MQRDAREPSGFAAVLAAAYATQFRLISACIPAAANDGAGTQVVRSIRVLAVGARGPAPRETATAPSAAAPEMPVKTREMASSGFQQALAAHQGTRTDRHVDQGIAEAVERQTRAMRELSRRAFPEPPAVPTAGGSVLAQWESILAAPELAGDAADR
ncbi:hypothetical protein [Streptomyces sp. NPDC057460]|uniref:hypothetical protein n=1 Tax=Streptomyces sp. NPDC057460 TaxID=3346141 RepID=UPI0036750985